MVLLFSILLMFPGSRFYETSAEYPAINGGDECGKGVRRMR
jgi:hypothetical protein